MTKYKLLGYNSGGYKSSREIMFDGMVSEEDNGFIQKILDTQSYIESFLVTEVIESSNIEQLNRKEK